MHKVIFKGSSAVSLSRFHHPRQIKLEERLVISPCALREIPDIEMRLSQDTSPFQPYLGEVM
jgi:hypothetical protein